MFLDKLKENGRVCFFVKYKYIRCIMYLGYVIYVINREELKFNNMKMSFVTK